MDYKLTENVLNSIFSRYPNKEAALLPMLRVIQRRVGHISPAAEEYVADLIGVHPSRVHEAVTFYSQLREKPDGKYLILVCDSISCSLLGAEEIRDHLKKRLKINVGETTPDKLFTLETVECLAHCDHSPTVMIDDQVMAPATPEEIDRLLLEKKNERKNPDEKL